MTGVFDSAVGVSKKGVIPRERSDRGNPFSCSALHRAASGGRRGDGGEKSGVNIGCGIG